MRDIMELLGRACLAVIFVFEAWDNIIHFGAAKQEMQANGVWWKTETILYAGCVFLVLGSLSLLFGYRVKLGAGLLLVYLVCTTFVYHKWWTLEPGTDRHTMSIIFMRDLAVIGGLLMVMVNGAGRYSVKRLLATTKVRQFF